MLKRYFTWLLYFIFGGSTVWGQSILEEKDISADPQVTGGSSCLLGKKDGFNPTGGYTVEMKVKAGSVPESFIDVFGATGIGKGFKFSVADSVFCYLNPALTPYPSVLHERLNSNKNHVYRWAVTDKDSVYAYRNGLYVGSYAMKESVLPTEAISGEGEEKENLLINGDFESHNFVEKNIVEEDNSSCIIGMDGWIIYPWDEWNSRVLMEKTDEGQVLRLQRYGWNAGWTDASVTQVIDVCPESTYSFSCLAKGGMHEGVHYGYIRLEEVQDVKKQKKLDIKTEDFETYSLEYTTTAECKQLRVIFGLKSPGAIGEWGAVPEVPIYVDDVVLKGKDVTYYDKALGFYASADAQVEYFAYDLTGAYAPVLADITTDQSVVDIAGDKGQQYVNLKVSGKGLQEDGLITFVPPTGVTVVPPKIPSGSINKNVRVLYDGTRNSFSDTLFIKSGETIRYVLLNVKGSALPIKSLAETAQVKGKKSFELSSFNPTGGYTMEIKARVQEDRSDGIKLYASTKDGNGFCFMIGDSLMAVDNAKSSYNNPDSVICRKNSNLMRTYRLAVTQDKRIFVYRDGNIVDTLMTSDYILPAEYTLGYQLTSAENLLKNSDFNGETVYNYMSDDPDKEAFAYYIEGWDIYPVEGWNTRQYITKWEIDESEELDKTNKALRLQRYGWNKGWSDGLIGQAVNVVGSQEYTLSVLAKGGIYGTTKYGYIRMEEVQNPSVGTTTSILSDDPKYYTLKYTPSAECKQLRVLFGLKSPGAIGAWGAVPEVPIYIDNPVLTGPKVNGSGTLGFIASEGTEVEYFAYDTDKGYAPVQPEIVVSTDTLELNGTGKSAVLKVSGSGLVPGENIRIMSPGGFSLNVTELSYDAVNKPIVVRMESSLKSYIGDIILTSGTTQQRVHVIGKGTALPEKDLSVAPVYKGNGDEWEVTGTEGFQPSNKGYSVEFKVKSNILNSKMTWYGMEENGRGLRPFVKGSEIGIYNGEAENVRLKMDNTDKAYTYRYAVTPDNRVFVYYNNVPVDTLFTLDYAWVEGFAAGNGPVKENLLYNPGFEEIYTEYIMPDDPEKDIFVDYIEGWTIMDPKNGWNARSHIKEMKVNDEYGVGNHVCGLERYRWEDGYDDGKVSQVVSVVPGTEYTLEVMAKGGIKKNGGQKLAYVRIEEVQATDKNVTATVESETFKTYSLKYTPTERCEQIRVVLGLQKAGKDNECSMAYFDNVKLSGASRTFEQKLGFIKANAELEYFTYDMTGAYAPILPKFDFSEERLEFSKTLEEKTIRVSTSDIMEGTTVALIPSSGFMVEPEVLPANQQDQNVTVTFIGSADREGTLTLKSGRMTQHIVLKGHATPFEKKDLSTSPVYSSPEGIYDLNEEQGFKPGKAGYTVELKGELEAGMGGSFEIGVVNSKERGFTITMTEEFMATSYDQGTIEFLGGEGNLNPGMNTYRFMVAPDNYAFIYKNSELIDTLNLNDYPVNETFIKAGESVEIDNIIANSHFNQYYEYTQYEEAYMLSYLESWHMTGIDEWNARAYIERDPDNTDNNVLTLERYDYNAGWADGMVTQVLNVCPNSTYTLKALVKGGSQDGMNLAYMGYEEVGTGVTRSINISGSNDYAEKSIKFTTGKECSQVKVSFWLVSSGKKPGPKCKLFVKDVTMAGKKPVYAPAIYLRSDGDFTLKYFTYDLSGAYAPVSGGVGIEVERTEAADEIKGYVSEGDVYLRNVPERSVISIYNSAGQLVKQAFNYVDNNPIHLDAKGLYIIQIISDNKKASIKIMN
ncbi:T9SS type A sorting domain-containing protein [Bacteroides sp.]